MRCFFLCSRPDGKRRAVLSFLEGTGVSFFFLFSSFFFPPHPRTSRVASWVELGRWKSYSRSYVHRTSPAPGLRFGEAERMQSYACCLLFLQLVLFLVELTSCVHNGSRQFNRPRHRGGKDRKMRTAPENGPASFALVAIWLRAIF